MSTQLKTFNVITYITEPKSYDVLPYFRKMWERRYKEEVKNKKDLKDWIIRMSQYQFWARCEYEWLIASWPFDMRNIPEKLMKYYSDKKESEQNSYTQSVYLSNIITQNMIKVDVHYQIMMNIDIITDILAEEFKIQ